METYSEMMKGRRTGRIVNQTTISSNRRTSEEEALIEPVNNVCSFNDNEIATEAQKEPKTYDEHASRNKKTFLLLNYKH